jgi:phosphoadenosine phosphosulfate reductase
MHITMVKKRLANGEACRKCVQAEELLKSRGLWDQIDEVVWADEADPSSPGMRLGVRFGVDLAPFFIARDEHDGLTVYDSVLKLINERLTRPRNSHPDSGSGSQPADDLDVAAEAQALVDRHPSEVLRFGLERWGASLGIAFSGAEDVVLIHMASESGLPFTVFSLDTGRLHPETYRFIDAVRRRYRIEINLVSPEAEPLQAFVKRKGLFSFYEDGHEECCSIRKVEPLRRTLRMFRAWATGQRRDQSPSTRSAIAVLERDRTFVGLDDGPLVKLNPLAMWTSAQVWQYIRDNGVPFNSLHERGFVSIGCEPCTRAIMPGEHERAGRWWWEESTKRECGLHIANVAPPATTGSPRQ